MLPVLFQLGPLKFYAFGSFIALGAVIAGLFIVRMAKARQLQTHHLFDTILYTLVLGLIGARATYYFLYQNQFHSFGQIFLFWQAGLVVLGGLVVGFFSYLYFIRKQQDPIWKMLDIGALGLLIGWAIGKFGCFLSGCSLGRPTETIFGVHGNYPIDLLSTIWAAVLFTVMLLTWLRNRLSDGVVFFLCLEGLFLGELLIKTLKLDFGEGLIRLEAIIYLGLIVAVYLIFWRLHGPRLEKNRFGSAVRNFVYRLKRHQ